MSARVFATDEPGPEFDHLVLLIETEERLIADVGFGDSFLDPLRLDGGATDAQQDGPYRLTESNSEMVLERRTESGWKPKGRRFKSFPRNNLGILRYQQGTKTGEFSLKEVRRFLFLALINVGVDVLTKRGSYRNRWAVKYLFNCQVGIRLQRRITKTFSILVWLGITS